MPVRRSSSAITRRDFAAGLLFATLAPRASAQSPPKQYRIAVVAAALPPARITESEGGTPWRALFSELRRLGYEEGRNIIIERYSAEGSPERQPGLAHEVVGRQPDLIVTGTGSLARDFAAATKTIPIVSALSEAQRQGLVASLARPGGNITGISNDAGREIWGKRLQILKEVVPLASRIGYLTVRTSWEGPEGDEVRQASQKLALSLIGLPLHEATEAEVRRVMTTEIAHERPEAIIASGANGTWAYRHLIIDLVAQNRLPAIYPYREFVDAGGLISYASDLGAAFRGLAEIVHRILTGTRPGDIPIQQPTKFELVVNLKTAKALGLTIPPPILVQADEVIE